MPESPGMTRWILVSLGGFSYLPEDSEDIPFGISGLAPSFIYIPLISPSLIVWYGNCSTESQLHAPRSAEQSQVQTFRARKPEEYYERPSSLKRSNEELSRENDELRPQI